ncbi:recombinase family protein [Chloroflexota bacterium]
MKKAFTIIRVSSEDQLKGYGPDVQWEDDIVPNSPLLGLEVDESYRRVIQESATSWERTKFEAAVREAISLYTSGKIQALVFPRVDRETRFVFGSMPLLAEVVQMGIEVYFAREKLFLNPNDPESVERYLNKATQAQAYVETMKYNTMKAKRRLLQQGVLPQGTGVGLYGYIWNRKTKKREIHAEEVEKVCLIFNRVASGQSLVSLAKQLNSDEVRTKGTKEGIPIEDRKHWHSLTIRRMIRNSAYVGRTYFKLKSMANGSESPIEADVRGTLLSEVTPAIIDEDLFQRANMELNKPKVRTGRPKNEYLLRHHVYCAICGRPLVGHCLNNKYRYYQCSAARLYENGNKTCSARYVRADKLESTAWSKIEEVLSNPDIILNEIQRQLFDANDSIRSESIEAEIEELERKMVKYDQRRNNLLDALELGEFTKDEILDRINNLKALRNEDEFRLNELVGIRDNIYRMRDARIKLDELSKGVVEDIHKCSPEMKKLALDALDIKVIASTDKVEIQGVIPLELPTTARTSG